MPEPLASPLGRRRLLLIGGGVVVLGIVVVALLALPLLSVKGDAEAAKADLTTALEALESGDLPTARERIVIARGHADAASDDMTSVSAAVWGRLPIAGTAVDDVGLLVSALEDAVSVAEIGVALYPSVAGNKATLFRDERLDLPSLATLTTSVREAGAHLTTADQSLAQIEGSAPFIGNELAANRDAAAAQVSPLAESYADLEPMLDDLPELFGGEGKRTYLVAMLNPAELRLSGGATLAFAPMTWDAGRLELGESIDLAANPQLNVRIRWRKVHGNTFHRLDKTLMRSATAAPSWSVSGKELLRAWQSATGVAYDGLLAVDVVTLARLFGLTGGVQVPGYGQLTEDNLVETLVGSYDDYYPDASVQDESSAAVIPAFKDQLFDGGNYFSKARVLKQAADGRHLALYFRDPDVQDGFSALGLEGDIAEPTGDYLGVFTQNSSGSKVDIHQRRSISDQITLEADGTAHHQLEVIVHNDTPPYVAPVPDPRSGYFTRWSGTSVSVFAPNGVQIERASMDGQPWTGRARNFFRHDYIADATLIEPAGRARFLADYRVPAAALTDGDELSYQLSIDPQGLVIPEQLELTVELPDGYTLTSLPDGWTANGNRLTFATDALDASQDWEFFAEAGN